MSPTYDAGDVAPLTLTVEPSDTSTVVTVTATTPDGEERPVVAVPDAERTVWTARLPLDSPGLWTTTWTVTGTGSGREVHEVRVRPAPGELVDGALVYATTADLARHLGDVPPPSARRMLADASRAVDRALIGAVYATTVRGMPEHELHRNALRDAVLVTVQSWGDADDPDAQWTDVTLGPVRLGGSTRSRSTDRTAAADSSIPEAAVAALTRAGLLPIRPMVIG